MKGTGYAEPAMTRSARRYHHGDLRAAFLAEAAKIVESDGVPALTLREIARRVGVSHAASTNHFADKGALLAELAAEGFEELAAELAAVKRSRSPLAHLRDTGRAYVRFALRRPGHFRVMFGQGAGPRGPSTRLEAAGMSAYALLERAVIGVMPPARARSPERVREEAFLAWSVVHGAAMLVLDRPLLPHLVSPDPDEAIRALVDHATEAVARAIAGKGVC
jgi:AcrR family transcriptional regulator